MRPRITRKRRPQQKVLEDENKLEGQLADLKRRIPILKRDRLAADLDQEVRNEEDRVKIHDPDRSAYSTYPGRRLRGAII
jgi:hypothetical protein